MGGQPHAPAASTPGKDQVPTVQEAGWTPGPVWTGAENLASTGIRSPDRPARSQSLYRLRYPAHTNNVRLQYEVYIYIYIYIQYIYIYTHTHTHNIYTSQILPPSRLRIVNWNCRPVDQHQNDSVCTTNDRSIYSRLWTSWAQLLMQITSKLNLAPRFDHGGDVEGSAGVEVC